MTATTEILRQSGNFFTETKVEDQYHGYPDRGKEFIQSTFHGRPGPGNRNGETCLKILKGTGAGLKIEITKFGKRNTYLSTELGKDELEMLLTYIDSIKDQMRNYSGEIVNQKY